MPEITLSASQLVSMIQNIAELKTMVTALNKQVSDQGDEIQELKLLAERGRGSLWMLMTLGGLVGAFISNIKTIIGLIIR